MPTSTVTLNSAPLDVVGNLDKPSKGVKPEKLGTAGMNVFSAGPEKLGTAGMNVFSEDSASQLARLNAAAGRTPGLSSIEEATSTVGKLDKSVQEALDFEKDKEARGFNAKTMLAAAKFGLDVLNANSAYGAIESSAQLNILEARRQGVDAIERGRQRSLDARVEGQLAGEQTVLSLAAQGQSIQGAGVEKARASLQDIGIYNGLQEEIDSFREALGFDLEEISINYQVDLAEIDRDSTIISSGINLAANVANQRLADKRFATSSL